MRRVAPLPLVVSPITQRTVSPAATAVSVSPGCKRDVGHLLGRGVEPVERAFRIGIDLDRVDDSRRARLAQRGAVGGIDARAGGAAGRAAVRGGGASPPAAAARRGRRHRRERRTARPESARRSSRRCSARRRRARLAEPSPRGMNRFMASPSVAAVAAGGRARDRAASRAARLGAAAPARCAARRGRAARRARGSSRSHRHRGRAGSCGACRPSAAGCSTTVRIAVQREVPARLPRS